MIRNALLLIGLIVMTRVSMAPSENDTDDNEHGTHYAMSFKWYWLKFGTANWKIHSL